MWFFSTVEIILQLKPIYVTIASHHNYHISQKEIAPIVQIFNTFWTYVLLKRYSRKYP